MYNGMKKAITLSYDDAVEQDVRLIEILDKYNLRATFNLNSGCLGKPGELIREGVRIGHNKLAPEKIAEVYKKHEVAAHTLTHPMLPFLDDAEVVRQVEEDRLRLSELCGYEVVGMAYPGGGMNNSDRVERLIREHTGIKYARTISHSYSFSHPQNLYRLNPTAHHLSFAENYRLADEFFASDAEGLFYIWGHSYEFDIHNTWDQFEEFCRYIANRDGVFYGTNKEVLL